MIIGNKSLLNRGCIKLGKYVWKMYNLNKSKNIMVVIGNFNIRND